MSKPRDSWDKRLSFRKRSSDINILEEVIRQPSRFALHDAFKTPPVPGAWPAEPEKGMEEEYVATCGEVDEGGEPTAPRLCRRAFQIFGSGFRYYGDFLVVV